MRSYLVEYFDYDDIEEEDPQFFCCQADDEEHAREQCINAYPTCSIGVVRLKVGEFE